MVSFILVCFLFQFCDCASYIDLTHPFDNDYTISWPSAQQFNFTIGFRGVNAAGYYYEGNDFSQAEHSGTHTDAPSHFSRGKWRIGDIPLERLFGPGVVIDIETRAERDPDTMLTVEDIKSWESTNGRIPDGSIVIMKSGFGKKYGNKTAYFGWPVGMEESNPKDTDHLHFPGFDPTATAWLVKNRDVKGVAVDTPSTDRGQSRDFQTHRILGENNVWGLENIANLDKLPPKDFTLYNLVYFLKEGSGAPSRVFALVNKASAFHTTTWILVTSILIRGLH